MSEGEVLNFDASASR